MPLCSQTHVLASVRFAHEDHKDCPETDILAPLMSMRQEQIRNHFPSAQPLFIQ